MSFIETMNGRLFYTAHNKKKDRAVLLIHGAGGTHQSWSPALRRLENTAVYALDLPGHGRSDPPFHDNINAYADAVIAFIDALALPTVTLLGHSMGGAIAQIVALRGHTAVTQLILLGTGARLPVSDMILGQIVENPARTMRLVNKFSWARSAPPEMITMGENVLLSVDPSILYADFFACNAFDVRDQLGKINIPTLVISGDKDKMTPIDNGRFLADKIPRAQFTLIEGGGHMMALEQPAKVAICITDFIQTDA